MPTPDVHHEVKVILPQQNHYNMSSGAYYGKQKVLLYSNQCVVVPPAFRQDVIWTAHTSALAGILATLEMLQKYFHWPGIKQDVETMLTDCIRCLHKKSSELKHGDYYAK